MKVLIAGAGIGGLTAALCLQQLGHSVIVVEQAPELSDIGAGIQISPNANKVFAKLGLLEKLIKKSFVPHAIEMRQGLNGKQIFKIPLEATAEKRWGAPYLHCHRADLIDVVLQSQILSELKTPSNVNFTGNIAWRMTVPTKILGSFSPPPTACIWVGPSKHVVTYRLRGGELTNLVAVVEQDNWQKESWSELGNKQDALNDFANWSPIITKTLQEADKLYRWALFDRAPLEKWFNKRVVLLGDACHPMLPFLAQGAAMAIEDAWVLATQLDKISKDNSSAEKYLQNYQLTRRTRTIKVQKEAKANRSRFHLRSTLTQFAAYGPLWLAGKLVPDVFHAKQDWLYGHDVTQ